jgi:fatty acid desaturase
MLNAFYITVIANTIAVLHGWVIAYHTQVHKSRHANGLFYGKAMLFLILWIGNYALLGNLSMLWLWMAVVAFGIVSLLLLLNIGHDAVHQAFPGNSGSINSPALRSTWWVAMRTPGTSSTM